MAGTGEAGDVVLWTSDGSVGNDIGDTYVGIVHAVTARYADGEPAQLTLAIVVPGIQAVLWRYAVQHGARAIVGGAEEGASVPIGSLRAVPGGGSRELVHLPAPMGTWRRCDE